VSIDFFEPAYISAWKSKEKLGMTINGNLMFQDLSGNFMWPEYELTPK
jgi:hypothetical protein